MKNFLKIIFFMYIASAATIDFAFAREAIIYYMKGNVQVQSAGSTLWRPGKSKMVLAKGDSIKTDNTSKVILLFSDGSRTTDSSTWR